MNIFTTNPLVNRLLLLHWNLYILLLAIITIDSWQAEKSFWIIWLLQAAPLVLLIPGLLQKHYRMFSWLCFLLLMYFTSYVVQVYSDTRSGLDIAGLIITIILFILAMFISRKLQRMVKNIA